MAQLNVSLPADLQRYVDGRVSDAGFADSDDYVRALIERDQHRYADDVLRVRRLVQEGIDSGVIDREPDDILDDIIADIRAADD
ncbi:antitoxin ParD1/3/4 [Sphingomonas insulae]|uniref:Type II toxin-antitoxin system ParD family antitoxin n=1 Tax=Sphingomonas insulae TaxID=424800 RepID=A0ABP3TBJ4_9SPHN|nr:type II toxin-antitoxin system ParD family antitoxin [Sphingomonas insulae]NIJ31248.1 antitoxin ParD1/3/4 [Sphingomonas insulae]